MSLLIKAPPVAVVPKLNWFPNLAAFKVISVGFNVVNVSEFLKNPTLLLPLTSICILAILDIGSPEVFPCAIEYPTLLLPFKVIIPFEPSTVPIPS